MTNSSQTAPKATIAVPEDRPSGLTIYTQPMFLRVNPATDLDFAIVDPGTALAASGELATVDYDRSTALRIGLGYRPQNTAWEIGATHTFLTPMGRPVPPVLQMAFCSQRAPIPCKTTPPKPPTQRQNLTTTSPMLS
ncbi:MAG: hypothetical protein HC780_13800 [Leptolyngbyaceae cyanobacterium CSU_1_3]|nr:hypothetical protein [Leptolyngbyaceae cyanobacterium CSU_1_3]